jgi:hypothetical protein
MELLLLPVTIYMYWQTGSMMKQALAQLMLLFLYSVLMG